MRTFCALVIGLSILLMPCAAPGYAQTDNPTLPADLLINTLTEETQFYTTLMRVDARTLQMSTFYVDDGSYLLPLSWSPSGNLLTILRSPTLNSEYIELCLVTSAGVLQLCFEDRIVQHAFGRHAEHYMVTWSEDERYLYFVSDYNLYSRHGEILDYWGTSLVKADVATGQTQQIIHQYPSTPQMAPPALYWTENLHYLMVAHWPWKVIDFWQSTEFTLPQNLVGLGDLMFCPEFSPQGRYLIAIASLNDELTGWVLTLPGGQIVHSVRNNRLQQAGIEWMDCPVWQSDDAAFYFLGGIEDEIRVFKYVLADDTLIAVKQLYPPDPLDSVFTHLFPFSDIPLSLAPDNATLGIPFLIEAKPGIETHILLPTNEWLNLSSDSVSYDPLWFPAEN